MWLAAWSAAFLRRPSGDVELLQSFHGHEKRLRFDGVHGLVQIKFYRAQLNMRMNISSTGKIVGGDSGDMVRHLFLRRKSVFGSTLMSATDGE